MSSHHIFLIWLLVTFFKFAPNTEKIPNNFLKLYLLSGHKFINEYSQCPKIHTVIGTSVENIFRGEIGVSSAKWVTFTSVSYIFGESQIRQFDITISVNNKILGFQIPGEDKINENLWNCKPKRFCNIFHILLSFTCTWFAGCANTLKPQPHTRRWNVQHLRQNKCICLRSS